MGEDAGLRQAMETYGDMVYRLALAQTQSSHDADDVFQEVFLRYLRSAPAFREEEHRKAWLLRVTVNCCKKLHGSFWRRQYFAWQWCLGRSITRLWPPVYSGWSAISPGWALPPHR